MRCHIITLLVLFCLQIGIFTQIDKSSKIIDNLLTKYAPIDVLFALKINSIIPLDIVPEYEGKAKKLWDNIKYIESNISNLKLAKASPATIEQAEALLKRMRSEFDTEKLPYIGKSIRKHLLDFLKNVKNAVYLDMIISYQNESDAQLSILIDLIMNAILNGAN